MIFRLCSYHVRKLRETKSEMGSLYKQVAEMIVVNQKLTEQVLYVETPFLHAGKWISFKMSLHGLRQNTKQTVRERLRASDEHVERHRRFTAADTTAASEAEAAA